VTAFLKHLFSAWTWRMAWRDSRTSRTRLLFFSSSIVLGVAGLAAIGTMSRNMGRAVNEQAKTLLGADLGIGSRQPFSTNEEKLLTSLGGKQAREVSFSSMVYFPKGGGSRLAQLRALSGEYPFYGKLETEPPEAAAEFKTGKGALVEANLLVQYDAKVGDNIRLGKLTLPVIGELKRVPGESAAFAVISPRVYLPMSELPKTELLNGGGLAGYRVFFQFPPGTDVEKKIAVIQPELDHYRLRTETVEQRKQDLGDAMDNFFHFLALCSLIPLLLGSIGVAGAIHVHVKQKIPSVAVLRCLGGGVGQTFAIYVAQGMALGAAGALAGALLGVVVPVLIPQAFADFFPFTFQVYPSWPAVAKAAAVGFSLCLLFSLLPLLEIRRVSPLAALRRAYESPTGRDPLRWAVIGCLVVGLAVFIFSEEKDWRVGIGFCAGLAVAFLVLAGTAKALVFVVRRIVRPAMPFPVRQGLANLHRPNNRTLLLLLALGFGVFLTVGIQMLERTLATELIVAGGPRQPNAVLFDIEPDQQKAAANLVESLHLPVLDELPLVMMRLSSIKGRSIDSILADKQSHIPSWTLRREYRSTYSDHLRDAERVIAGKWIGRVENSSNAAPISVEKQIAQDLHVGLGDEIIFDVQGVPVKCRVASLREVNWRRMQPNFFVVFPDGVLESAPSMGVLLTHVDSGEQSAALQRKMVRQFPNISVIDLTLVLQTLDAILSKLTFVIQFMALFTVFTGILVMAGTLMTGHFQRVRESVLLRTLGASRRQIQCILAVEYLSLGALAAGTGCLLALAGVWALSAFVFHIHFAPVMWPLICGLVATPVLTAGLGLLMSRGILNQPPLVTLREDAI
jgi:putative ABC transport system permease protein